MKPIKKVIIKDEKQEDGYSEVHEIMRMRVGPQEYVDIIDNTFKICIK